MAEADLSIRATSTAGFVLLHISRWFGNQRCRPPVGRDCPMFVSPARRNASHRGSMEAWLVLLECAHANRSTFSPSPTWALAEAQEGSREIHARAAGATIEHALLHRRVDVMGSVASGIAG
jgi:hypothetical protein